MRVAHIIWIDSETDIGWQEMEPDLGVYDACHSVGFLLAETAHYYILANSYDPATAESNGRISIPKVSVKEVRTICQIKV